MEIYFIIGVCKPRRGMHGSDYLYGGWGGWGANDIHEAISLVYRPVECTRCALLYSIYTI